MFIFLYISQVKILL